MQLLHTAETSTPCAPRPLHVIEGTATVFVERPSQRLVWVGQPANEPDPCRSKLIKQGDFLVVTDPTGKVLFEGDVVPEYSLMNPAYTLLPVAGHQVPARGFEISWHQKGWEPTAWANLFTPGTNTARIARSHTIAA